MLMCSPQREPFGAGGRSHTLRILDFLCTNSNFRNALNVLLCAKCHALSLYFFLFKIRDLLLFSFNLIAGTSSHHVSVHSKTALLK